MSVVSPHRIRGRYAGLLGISYGILSTSWDPRREGSASGVTEFKANLPIVLDRFRGRL